MDMKKSMSKFNHNNFLLL